MHKTDIIAVKILPSPVDAGKLAVARILDRDIVALIVLLITEIKRIALGVLLSFRSDMDRKVQRVLRHSVLFMCSHDDRSA